MRDPGVAVHDLVVHRCTQRPRVVVAGLQLEVRCAAPPRRMARSARDVELERPAGAADLPCGRRVEVPRSRRPAQARPGRAAGRESCRWSA